MAFDGLTTYLVTHELSSHLIGGKVDKIFQPNSNEIILGVYSDGIKYALDIVTTSNFYRMCLTTHLKPNPSFAPNFCMVLRKHLQNTRITKIENHSLERLVTIEFEGHSKSDDVAPKKLMIELMGKHSNIILVNSQNVIIDALKHFTTESHSYRNIVPGALYTFPISSKLDFMEIKNSDVFYQKTIQYVQEELSFLDITSTLKISDILPNTFAGISKTFVLSMLQKLQLDDVFSEVHMKQIYQYIDTLIQNPSEAIVQPFDNHEYSICLTSSVKQENLQISFFLDDYYTQKETAYNFDTYRNHLSKLILTYLKRLNNKLLGINAKLQECKNTDLYRLYGELITNNLYRIVNKHSDIIQIENYYDNNHLITIPLDKSVSPAMNAKRYFKKYNKLKNAKQIVELQKTEVEDEIHYLESIVYEFELAETISDLDHIYDEFYENVMDKNPSFIKQKLSSKKKKQKASKKSKQAASKMGTPMQCYIDGFKVLIGKNNQQNDCITKQANDDDIWFHAKDIHGSHVILKTNNKMPEQDTINKVASLAAFYSKASESSNVPVDYTFVKYVQKPSKTKPGMVVYTNHKNVIVKPNHM